MKLLERCWTTGASMTWIEAGIFADSIFSPSCSSIAVKTDVAVLSAGGGARFNKHTASQLKKEMLARS